MRSYKYGYKSPNMGCNYSYIPYLQALDTSSLNEGLHLRPAVKQQSECGEFRAPESDEPLLLLLLPQSKS